MKKKSKVRVQYFAVISLTWDITYARIGAEPGQSKFRRPIFSADAGGDYSVMGSQTGFVLRTFT